MSKKAVQLPHFMPSNGQPLHPEVEELLKARISGALDKEAAGHVARFFSDFAMTGNVSGSFAREKPFNTPHFGILRQAARRSFLDKIIIKARKDQFKRIWQRAIEGNSRTVGFKVVHDNHSEADFEVTDDIKRRCREMEDFLLDPSPEEFSDIYPHGLRPHDGLKGLVSQLIEAELVIDRKIIRRYPRSDNKGFAAFHWLPGDTVKPISEAVKEWARKNGNKNIKEAAKKPGSFTEAMTTKTAIEMSYKHGMDFVNSAFVQEVDGQPVACFTNDEIALHVSNPSDELNRLGYGESRLEMSLELTTVFLYQWAYNREIFNTNYPDRILKVAGEYDKEGLEAFKSQLRMDSGPKGHHRIPVIATGEGSKDSVDSLAIESIALRDTPKDMLFDQLFRFLVILKCAAYGVHPNVINFNIDSGGGTSLFGGGQSSRADEIEESKDQGLRPALLDMCEFFTKALVKPRYKDLKVVVVGLDEDDEKNIVELRKERTSTWLTRNEARVEDGLEPVGDPEDPENPWNYPADAPVSNYMNTIDMLAQGDEPQPGEEGYEEQGGEGGYEDPQDDGVGFENTDESGKVVDIHGGANQEEQFPLFKPQTELRKSRRRRRPAKREGKFLRIKVED